MGERLKAMREAAAKAKLVDAKEVAGTVEPQPLPPKRPKKEKPPDDGPLVVYRCGHKKPAAHFKGQDCGACRNAAIQKNHKAQLEKRQRRQAEKQASQPQFLETRNGRLPDGSVIVASYEAATETWHGKVSCPPQAGGTDVTEFADSSSSLEGLFRLLGKLAMDWAARQE